MSRLPCAGLAVCLLGAAFVSKVNAQQAQPTQEARPASSLEAAERASNVADLDPPLAPRSDLAPPTERDAALGWRASLGAPPAEALNPEVHGGFDDAFVYTGITLLTLGSGIGIALHADYSVDPCVSFGADPSAGCNDWVRPTAFMPLFRTLLGLRGGGDVGAIAFITGGATSGLELIGLVFLLIGVLHHHPSLTPEGVRVAFD